MFLEKVIHFSINSIRKGQRLDVDVLINGRDIPIEMTIWNDHFCCFEDWWELPEQDQLNLNDAIEGRLFLDEVSDADDLRRSDYQNSKDYVDWINGGSL